MLEILRQLGGRAMKIVAYYRIGRRAGSAQAQRSAVQTFAQHHDAMIIAEYADTSADRPKLAEAIARAKLAKATLVVAEIGRIARNVAFTTALMESGVEFVALDNPQVNRLTVHVLVAAAEDERLRRSRRTRDAMAAAKARGVKLGSARPGHWDGIEHKRGWRQGAKAAGIVRTQRAKDAYAFLLPKIRELRAAGRTLEEIAEWLTEQGHQTTAGKPWNTATVCRVLQRADGVEPGKRRKVPASALARMKRMRDRGSTLEAIAKWLNAHGHKTGAGIPWTAHSVHRKLYPR
jgi:DNA invertase Pin-like site-specific DNA recombinase